jgi:predicted metal-binding transcription factor (methanogenesis marker protein 9)
MALDKEKVLEELRKVYEEIKAEREKEVKKEVEKVEKRVGATYDYLLKKVENALKKVEEGDLKDIVELTCYRNLGFCCGLERDCPLRDMVLSVLNIDREEYKHLKEEFGKMLLTGEGRKRLREFFDSVKEK